MQIDERMAYSCSLYFSDQNSYRTLFISNYGLQDMIFAILNISCKKKRARNNQRGVMGRSGLVLRRGKPGPGHGLQAAAERSFAHGEAGFVGGSGLRPIRCGSDSRNKRTKEKGLISQKWELNPGSPRAVKGTNQLGCLLMLKLERP
jgi:hypothetical protein